MSTPTTTSTSSSTTIIVPRYINALLSRLTSTKDELEQVSTAVLDEIGRIHPGQLALHQSSMNGSLAALKASLEALKRFWPDRNVDLSLNAIETATGTEAPSDADTADREGAVDRERVDFETIVASALATGIRIPVLTHYKEDWDRIMDDHAQIGNGCMELIQAGSDAAEL